MDALLPLDLWHCIVHRLAANPQDSARFAATCRTARSLVSVFSQHTWLPVLLRLPIGLPNLLVYSPSIKRTFEIDLVQPKASGAEILHCHQGWLLVHKEQEEGLPIVLVFNPFARVSHFQLPTMFIGGNFRGACFSATPHSSPDWMVFIISADSETLTTFTWRYGQDRFKSSTKCNIMFLPSCCSPVYSNGRLYCLDAEGSGRVGVYDPNDDNWFFLQSSACPLAQGFCRHWRASLMVSSDSLLAAFFDPNNLSSLALFKMDTRSSTFSGKATWDTVCFLDDQQSVFLNFHSFLLVEGPQPKEDKTDSILFGNQVFYSMVLGDSTPVPARVTCTDGGMFFTRPRGEVDRQWSFPLCSHKADPVICSLDDSNVNQLLRCNNYKEFQNCVWIVPATHTSNYTKRTSANNHNMWEPYWTAREDNVGQILNQRHLNDSTTGKPTLNSYLSPWVVYLHNPKKRMDKGQKRQFKTLTYVSAVDGRCYNTDVYKGSHGNIWSEIEHMGTTPQGWMVVLRVGNTDHHELSGQLLLLNPVSDEHIPLPPLPYMQIFYFDIVISRPSRQGSNFHRTAIVAACKDTQELLCYELRDNTVGLHWQRHHHGQDMVIGLATCSVSGSRVYILNFRGALVCMDLDHTSRGFTKIADPLTPYWHMSCARYLIESNGELFLVFRQRKEKETTYPTIFRLYKMDFTNARWSEIVYKEGCLGGRAFFLGEFYWADGIAVCIERPDDEKLTTRSSQLQEDCVYFFRQGDNRFYCYNMQDESISAVSVEPKHVSIPWIRVGWITYPQMLFTVS